MTQEQHEKALELTKAIKQLKEHSVDVKRYKDFTLRVVSRNDYRNNEILLNQFLPISKEDFVNLYIAKVEKAIADAETEFNNL